MKRLVFGLSVGAGALCIWALTLAIVNLSAHQLPAVLALVGPWCLLGAVAGTTLPLGRLVRLTLGDGLRLTTSLLLCWGLGFGALLFVQERSFDLLEEIAGLFATVIAVGACLPWLVSLDRASAERPNHKMTASLLGLSAIAAGLFGTWIAAPIVNLGPLAVLAIVAAGALATMSMRLLFEGETQDEPPYVQWVGLGGLVIVLASFVAFSTMESVRQSAFSDNILTRRLATIMVTTLDGDGDGVAQGLGLHDCDDTNPDVFPGASERINNGVDEDCDGADATAPATLTSSVSGGHLLPGQTRNIILVTLDAVRADHLSMNGYERPTSPNLDNLAKLSLVFEQAWSASNFTALSLYSLMTGLYPLGYLQGDQVAARPGQTLAEQLRRRGFITEAVVDLHPPLPHVYGGFERIDDSLGMRAAKAVRNRSTGSTAMEITELATARVEHLSGQERPFFLWLHYSEPHAAYLSHANFDFGPNDIDRYDSEIAFADHAFGLFLAHLKKIGRLKDTAIVVTSDHGEAFGEHGGVITHGQTLYENELHVPLVIYLPNSAGNGHLHKRIPNPVDATDVVPTLRALLGLEQRAPSHGESLLPLALTDTPQLRPGAFAETRLPYARLQALRIGEEKYIFDHLLSTVQRFDLDADPKERSPQLGTSSDYKRLTAWLYGKQP